MLVFWGFVCRRQEVCRLAKGCLSARTRSGAGSPRRSRHSTAGSAPTPPCPAAVVIAYKALMADICEAAGRSGECVGAPQRPLVVEW